MSVVLTIHSIVRWLIVLVAVAALIKFAWGWWQKQAYDRTANALASAFAGLMDTQALLGTLFFIWNGMALENGFSLRYRWEHLGLMTVAVIISHLPARWKKSADEIRYRNGLIVIIVALVLVVVGISSLPGNRWQSMSGLF